MVAYPQQHPGELQKLAAMLTQLRRDVDELRSQGMRVPIVDGDPLIWEASNVWAFTDGRLRLRTSQGVFDMSQYPKIPTLAADPAASTGINIWVRTTDNNLRVRTGSGIVSYAPAAAGSSTATASPATTSAISKPANAQLRTYVSEFPALWSASFREDGSKRVDGTGGLYFGVSDSTNGRQKSQIGFDSTAIATALAGATLRRVELYLSMRSTYLPSGADLHIGAHSNAAEPATWGGIYRSDVTMKHFGASQARWVDLSTAFLQWLYSGTARGVSINQLSDSLAAAGVAQGVGTGSPPRLRITYVK